MNFNPHTFDLFLFTTNSELAKECIGFGVNAIIIDWENKHKEKRQEGYPTQINYDTLDDLIQMRKNISDKIICRVNKFDMNYSVDEINAAIENGADEILLPMVEQKDEICKVIDIVNNRCKLGILIETDAAVNNAESFVSLPLSRVYIGLNDLHISRKTKSMFEPLLNNTVSSIKNLFRHIPVGVGGITHPLKGHPIPCNVLIDQYAHLDINFSFLRRSFLKDIKHYGTENMLTDIKTSLQEAALKKQLHEIDRTEAIKSYLYSTVNG